MRWLIAAVVCALASMAQAHDDPDTEAAHRHSNAARAAYELGDYRGAIAEFEAARALKPLPELDYNIGRCLERIEQWGEAAAAFQRFVDAQPQSPDAPAMRERIAVLRSRVRQPPPAPPPPSAPAHDRRALIAPVVLGAGAVVLAAAGTGGYLSAWSDYQSSLSTCQHACNPSQLGSLHDKVQRAEVAGGVLWGLAAVAAAVDVVLWIRWSRSPRPQRSASLVRF